MIREFRFRYAVVSRRMGQTVIRIRTLTADDESLGLQLSRQAGWNQTAADWSRFRTLRPDGCFVAEWEGRSVGTTTTCVFDTVAWVAMVLVDEAMRGRGIGKALMAHALEFLESRGVRTIRLDATPLGRLLYEKLGFVPEYSLTRFGGRPHSAETIEGSEPLLPEHVEPLIALDRDVTGTDRSSYLRRLIDERPESVRVACREDRVDGFLMARPGRLAVQIGPCLAGPESGALLLTEARHRFAGQEVFVDVPDDHDDAVSSVRAGGLVALRPLLRMCRGERIAERRDRLWTSSGPEMG